MWNEWNNLCGVYEEKGKRFQWATGTEPRTPVILTSVFNEAMKKVAQLWDLHVTSHMQKRFMKHETFLSNLGGNYLKIIRDIIIIFFLLTICFILDFLRGQAAWYPRVLLTANLHVYMLSENHSLNFPSCTLLILIVDFLL